jgi:hypothetical protein
MAPFDRSYALKSIRKFNIPHKYRGDWHRRNHAPVKSQARALINHYSKLIKAKFAARRRRRVIKHLRPLTRHGYIKPATYVKRRKVPWQVTARKRTRRY